MTDSVMFVKETKTCHYILVINTPRLCGEPGFKSRIDQRDEALIRCRQVVDAATLANVDPTLPEADHPFLQRRAPATNSPPLDAAEAPSGAAAETDGDDASQRSPESAAAKGDTGGLEDHSDLLRRALKAILEKAGHPQGNDGGPDADTAGTAPRVVVEDVGDGEVLIEFISEIEVSDGGDAERRVEDLSRMMGDAKVFEDALRAAGFEVRDKVEVEVGVGGDPSQEEEKNGSSGSKRTVKGAAKGRRPNAQQPERDEL